MPTELAVVIVNYRTAGLAIDCLRSLEGEVAACPGTRVVVVDNASADRSAERIDGAIAAEGWAEWASLLPAEENGGFAAGNNAAIRRLLADPEPPRWILLLNPDTIVRAGALARLLDAARGRPRAGIVGSRLEHPDGTLQQSTFRFHSVLTELDGGLRLGAVSRLLRRWSLVFPQPDAPCRADWVSGASMLVRRDVFETVGLLDEGFFLYFEEVDLCRRAARAGWECWHEPASRVVHLVGQSTGVDLGGPARRLPGYVLESRRRYFVKNHGFAYAVAADLAWLAGHLAWRLRMRLQRRPDRAAPGLLGDFLRHSALLRGGKA
jgi:hypothetical protein